MKTAKMSLDASGFSSDLYDVEDGEEAVIEAQAEGLHSPIIAGHVDGGIHLQFHQEGNAAGDAKSRSIKRFQGAQKIAKPDEIDETEATRADHYSVGDEVVILKEDIVDGHVVKSPFFGETATVTDPDWETNECKVLITSGDQKGETKSYKPEDLRGVGKAGMRRALSESYRSISGGLSMDMESDDEEGESWL
mmetsp:Transcript_44691/g.121778  ORF Transcript_44691/g.121778 Transcript_44691/m.121778 type:complete len:193 (-) Transcript_44691:610-1188(-)